MMRSPGKMLWRLQKPSKSRSEGLSQITSVTRERMWTMSAAQNLLLHSIHSPYKKVTFLSAYLVSEFLSSIKSSWLMPAMILCFLLFTQARVKR